MSIIGVKRLIYVLNEMKEDQFDYNKLSAEDVNILINGYVTGMRINVCKSSVIADDSRLGIAYDNDVTGGDSNSS